MTHWFKHTVVCVEADHDGPHLIHPWNGSEYLVNQDGLTYVQTRPDRFEIP